MSTIPLVTQACCIQVVGCIFSRHNLLLLPAEEEDLLWCWDPPGSFIEHNKGVLKWQNPFRSVTHWALLWSSSCCIPASCLWRNCRGPEWSLFWSPCNQCPSTLCPRVSRLSCILPRPPLVPQHFCSRTCQSFTSNNWLHYHFHQKHFTLTTC